MKPLSDDTIPSDHLSQSIILTGINSTIVLERALDKIPLSTASAVIKSSADINNGILLQALCQELSDTFYFQHRC